MIDVEVNLGKELAHKLNKMTKTELLNHLVVVILKSQVQSQTISELEIEKSKSFERLKELKGSLWQAKNMIRSIMDRW